MTPKSTRVRKMPQPGAENAAPAATLPALAAYQRKRPPDFIPPQLARAVQVAPAGEAWLHEVKLDGYRAICRIEHGAGAADVRIRTRSGQDWSARFGAIVIDLESLPCHDAVLDGEIVALREDGVSDFQKLANLIGRRATDKAAQNPALHFFAFDLLWLDGKDLRSLPLSQRKVGLQALLHGAGPHVRFCDHVLGNGPEFFAAACRMGLEGSVAKRVDAPYTAGRGNAWVKVKCLERQEFVVVGWTDPEGNRSAFGALLLAVHRPDGKLYFAGRVGTGFTELSLNEVASEIKDLAADTPPVVDPPTRQEAKGVHWLRPKLVCEVQFAEWTDDDRLRQPSFRGLRRDRAPEDVTDERVRDDVAPQSISRRGTARGQTTRARLRKTMTTQEVATVPPAPLPVPAGKDTVLLEGVRLTHPNKVLFPEQGVTKLELAQYHARVADRLLPYVADRPLTLLRCPEGPAKGPCFFQKHVSESMPPHIFAVTVRESAGPAQFITIHDRLGLLALVQIGALELHPWGARNDALDKPDVLVFDLDPAPGLGWPRLVEAALLVRAHLRRFDLESFVRTTGGKGLHVVVPVVQELGWQETKRFCGLLAEAVVRSAPERFTATMTKAKRAGRIFVDWFRNGEGATSVATWSPRARLNAPIAVPISWDELPMVGRGDRWHVGDVEERLARPDPWADFHTLRQRIPHAAFAELGG